MDEKITIYTNLAATLRERLAVIADREAYNSDPQSHLAHLERVSKNINELEQKLPQPVDPQLSHYLQRCSYDKALTYLEQQLQRY